MSISLSADWITQAALAFMLMSLRLLGLFLSAPMLSFRAAPLRLRLMLCLVLAAAMLPVSFERLQALQPDSVTYLAAAIEVMIGVVVGFAIRIGMVAIDLAAEILSVQTGLSFAATYARDSALPSGVIGEFLGMCGLALLFLMDLHLILIEVVAQSFLVVPFGSWPTSWDRDGLMALIAASFKLGIVLSAPIIVVHGFFSMVQSVLGRTSPQLNLFSVGFAVSVPLGLVVMGLMLPELPRIVERAVEPALEFIRHGLEKLPAR